MKRVFVLIVFCLLIAGGCVAQLYLEPMVGYQLNLRNGKYSQPIVALQASYATGSSHDVTLQIQQAWAVSVTSSDSAFSQNPALPVYAAAQKTIRPAALSLSLGNRFKVAGVKTANVFSLLLSAGVRFEKMEVSYAYDKNNYTILNPDQTRKRTVGFISIGPEYMRVFRTGRLFTRLNLALAINRKKVTYPYSYDFPIPLSISAGYSIQLKSGKYEKK